MSVHACKTANPCWANFVDDTKHVSTDDRIISVIRSDKSADQQHQGLLRCVTALTWFHLATQAALSCPLLPWVVV